MLDLATCPRKVNLGCGWDKREGYLNVDLHDFHDPDLVADVRDLAMFPDDFFDEVVAQDLLEHLPRADGPTALREWARVLRPGGTLVLRVPNLLGLAVLLANRHDPEQQRELVMCLFGTQAYNGDFHQNGYTELLLRHELRDAGFAVEEITSRDEWLFDVVAVRRDHIPPVTIEQCTFMVLHTPGVPPPEPEPAPEVVVVVEPEPQPASEPAAVSGKDELKQWGKQGVDLATRAARKAARSVRKAK